jgi:hypothetical protein
VTIAIDFDTTSLLLTGVILVGLGLIICFFGYRFFRLYLGFIGFMLGFYVGAALAADMEPVAQLLIGLGIGFVFGLVSFALFVIGFVLAGALLGASFAVALLTLFTVSSNAALALIVVAALIGAGAAFILKDLIIMLATAFTGAGQVVVGGLLLLFPNNVTQNEAGLILLEISDLMTILALFTAVVLTVAGLSFQSRNFND